MPLLIRKIWEILLFLLIFFYSSTIHVNYRLSSILIQYRYYFYLRNIHKISIYFYGSVGYVMLAPILYFSLQINALPSPCLSIFYFLFFIKYILKINIINYFYYYFYSMLLISLLINSSFNCTKCTLS